MQDIQKFEFVGTSKDFEEAKITLNGERLDQVSVNILGKHGVLKHVGEGRKPARGRTPKLYKAVSSAGMLFEQGNLNFTSST